MSGFMVCSLPLPTPFPGSSILVPLSAQCLPCVLLVTRSARGMGSPVGDRWGGSQCPRLIPWFPWAHLPLQTCMCVSITCGVGRQVSQLTLTDQRFQHTGKTCKKPTHCQLSWEETPGSTYWSLTLSPNPLSFVCVGGGAHGNIGSPQETAVRNFYFFVMLSGV